ncbi:S-adenosylmethionine transporter [Auriscalpium vulgare]|uniref:S-adenosylmethionine transporter n=1 Tax=Auriscalpium vulgare TaxID=40419 RepID=A0ACB8SCL1_9AGAM|nr:S-adenosylmethionine transporter [Auriscalpium vulgare]
MSSDSTHAPSFTQSLAAGGLAGTSVDLLFFPIDAIKTRLQSDVGFARAGGFKGIYKGVGSVIVGSAPGAALFFSTYNTLKNNLPTPPHLAPLNHMISASVGEVAACLIRVPTEVIKTRSQTSSYGALADSSFKAARLLWKTEGLSGFYRGFGITVMREIPFTSLQFPLYELFKRRFSLYLYAKPAALQPYEAALCGSVAGGIAAALTTPLDVLKTRIMLDLRDTSHPSYLAPLPRLRHIYASEGARALCAGIVPRTLWISAGGAVFLGMYEWTIEFMHPAGRQ